MSCYDIRFANLQHFGSVGWWYQNFGGWVTTLGWEFCATLMRKTKIRVNKGARESMSVQDNWHAIKRQWDFELSSTLELVWTRLYPFSPSKFIDIYILLKISIQSNLFCCGNIGKDFAIASFHIQRKSLPNCLKGKYGYHLGEFSNISFVVFGAGTVRANVETHQQVVVRLAVW